MWRRIALPLITITVALCLWWMDRRVPRKETPPVPDAPPAQHAGTAPLVTSAQQFVGDTPVTRWVRVEEFETELALFESVFWEPADTTSLRKLIRETPLVRGRKVLEIGTGSGLVSLACLRAGASAVLATDINPQAVRNAVYNAEKLGLLDRFEVRLVPRDDPTAWSVIRDDEQFDLIISNPPWENARPETVADFALYDTDFRLLRSLLAGARSHLRPGGKVLLAYGCVDAIRTIERIAPEYGLTVRRLDTRQLDELPEVFLPGMLLELTPTVGP